MLCEDSLTCNVASSYAAQPVWRLILVNVSPDMLLCLENQPVCSEMLDSKRNAAHLGSQPV